MTTPTRSVVYVVDDDQGMLDSTVWLLESVGLNALAFTSGQAFLDACDPALSACVVLDVRMPGMGGLNVQQALQARGVKMPVIFVSGHADVPIVVRAFKAGAHDFIEKPYNQQLLLDSVQEAPLFLSLCCPARTGLPSHRSPRSFGTGGAHPPDWVSGTAARSAPPVSRRGQVPRRQPATSSCWDSYFS